MVPHEFFGIGWGELMLLLVLAVIFFGPEKLPEFSRKAARVVYVVRVFADQATSQLKEELGPEYKDLTLADLNPKTFVQKTLLADIQGDLDDIKKELDEVRTDLSGSVADVSAAGDEVKALVGANLGTSAPTGGASPEASRLPAPVSAPAVPVVPMPPWDDEAT